MGSLRTLRPIRWKTFFIYDPSVTIKAWKWVQRLSLSLHQRAEWWQPAACRPEYQWALNKTCWNGTTLWDVCHIRTAALRPSASLSLSLLYKKHINILHSCCFNPATGCQYSALKKVLRPAVWWEEQRCSEVCSSWYNTLLNTFISSRRFALCAALVCDVSEHRGHTYNLWTSEVVTSQEHTAVCGADGAQDVQRDADTWWVELRNDPVSFKITFGQFGLKLDALVILLSASSKVQSPNQEKLFSPT